MKKDQDHQTANRERPEEKFLDTPRRPSLPCLGKEIRGSGCVHVEPDLLTDFSHTGPHIEHQGPKIFSRQDPSMPSVSVAEMVSRRYRRKLKADSLRSNYTKPSIPRRRSLFSVRLYLLWLNFLLIPTRIRYMLGRIYKDSF